MKNNKKFERSAKIRQVKAFFLTIIITGTLFGGIFYSTGTDVKEFVPDVVKNWFESEESSTEDVAMKP